MGKKCILCFETIDEEYDKLKGTIIRVVDENKKRNFVYVCSNCQKQDKWLENAKVKGV